MIELYVIVSALGVGQPVRAYATQNEACATYESGQNRLYLEQIDRRGNVTFKEGECEVVRQFREKK